MIKRLQSADTIGTSKNPLMYYLQSGGKLKMNFQTFKKELKEQGFSNSQIMKLNRLGYYSALDAHQGMKKDIPNFHYFCQNIGREFVLENLEMFTEML